MDSVAIVKGRSLPTPTTSVFVALQATKRNVIPRVDNDRRREKEAGADE